MDNIESRREFLRKAPLRLAGACAVMSEVPEACARVVSDRVFEFLHDEGAVPFLEKIAVPSGLRRVWVPKGSFGEWMRQLPVKQRNNGIFDKDGKRVFGSEMAHSIVDMDVWRYQECADVAMRLWGEYLYATDQLHRLDMRLENGSRNPKSRPYDRRSFKKYFLYQFV